MATPETARVPVAILSSDWKTLEAGMQCVQGKPLIGPLSLADGDEEFVRRVSLAARYGAAVLVALAEEEGDARSYLRKAAVAARVVGADRFPLLRCGSRSWGLSGTGKRDRGRGCFRHAFGLLRCLPRDPATVSAMETVRQDRGCI